MADPDDAVARFAFRAVAAWKAADVWSGRPAINLSDVSFVRPGMAERIFAMAAAASIKEGDVAVEGIREVRIERDVGRVIDVFEKMRNAVKRVDLDDFGTGHASLSHPANLSIDRVKPNGRFVIVGDRNLSPKHRSRPRDPGFETSLPAMWPTPGHVLEPPEASAAGRLQADPPSA